jgi:hypothetical protein
MDILHKDLRIYFSVRNSAITILIFIGAKTDWSQRRSWELNTKFIFSKILL